MLEQINPKHTSTYNSFKFVSNKRSNIQFLVNILKAMLTMTSCEYERGISALANTNCVDLNVCTCIMIFLLMLMIIVTKVATSNLRRMKLSIMLL